MLYADYLHENQCEIKPGVWVAARPELAPFICRLKDAWQVIIGKADAVKFRGQ
jgi:hypothetical protein